MSLKKIIILRVAQYDFFSRIMIYILMKQILYAAILCFLSIKPNISSMPLHITYWLYINVFFNSFHMNLHKQNGFRVCSFQSLKNPFLFWLNGIGRDNFFM